MENMAKGNDVSAYLGQIALAIFLTLFFLFPLLFTTATTENFILPKQILLIASSLVVLLITGAKMISDGKVVVRRTPLDVALLLFVLTVFGSALFALNRFESVTLFVPFLLAAISYFLIVNVVRLQSSLFTLALSLVAAAAVVSILAILSLAKVYVLPFPITRSQTFTPLGSLLDQAVFLALMLPLAASLTLPRIANLTSLFRERRGENLPNVGLLVATVIIGLGLAVSMYELVTLEKPLLLPFTTGFQTAFAAISQDTRRLVEAILFGSGFGTYATVFTRFKQASFNLNENLWSFTFFRSSSFFLELLATTGIAGAGSFLYLIVRTIKTILPKRKRLSSLFRRDGAVTKNPFTISLFLILLFSFLLPFSFSLQAFLFLFLGLFVVSASLATEHKSSGIYEVELSLIALKKGLFSLSHSQETARLHSFTKFLPVSFFLLSLLFSIAFGFFVFRYVASDVLFQKSLLAAAKNNGLETYNNQVNALQLFPYKDGYYRIYSQTNLALANSLSQSFPKDASPSAQTQTTIYTLIQQSINSARRATTLGPQTALNWQNLSSIYRSLIGFGQNSENFAILASQQAVLLDPNNPQSYIALGGLYYQLGQWDNAQRQFQIAVGLKPDFANAYYNLGHALEAKGDLAGALTQYQTVKSLVLSDKENLKKITAEIDALSKRIGPTGQAASPSAAFAPRQTTQPPLGITGPSTQLPELKPKLELPPPPLATSGAR